MEERIITTTEDFVEEVIRTDAVKKVQGKGGIVALAATAGIGLGVLAAKLWQNHKAKKAQSVEVTAEEIEDEVDDEECFEEE